MFIKKEKLHFYQKKNYVRMIKKGEKSQKNGNMF